MHPFSRWLSLALLVASAAPASSLAADAFAYPAAPRRPVTEVYQGVTVTSDYRWMEDVASPEVRDWIAQENALTRKVLDGSPKRAAIFAELSTLLGQAPTSRFGFRYEGGRLFAMKRQPPANQPRLVVLRDPRDLADGIGRARPERAQPEGHDRDRLVPAVARRQDGRGEPVR